MKYLVSVISKAALFPVAVIMLLPAYILFVIDPSYKKFSFKMDR